MDSVDTVGQQLAMLGGEFGKSFQKVCNGLLETSTKNCTWQGLWGN